MMNRADSTQFTARDPAKEDVAALERPAVDEAIRPLALLLDLSGNKELALDWASRQLPGHEIRTINKADLKLGSRREAMRRIRALSPRTFALFTSDFNSQSARGALTIFGALAGARRVLFGDAAGRTILRSRLSLIAIEVPRVAFEVLIGYGVVVPFSWLLVSLLQTSLGLRKVVRAARAFRPSDPDRTRSRTAIHIRATLSTAGEGGMPTHVAGFRAGALALGNRLQHLESGRPPLGSREILPGVFALDDRTFIVPSPAVGATKAVFELWNNLVFSFRSLQLLDEVREADFIYQRYSRFNFTGVMISAITGIPLALEFNGSEVWVSRHWDLIGQQRLLKLFERLNLRAADLIFVVSEVAKNDLLTNGNLDPARVVVNPNGVNPDLFRPNCGGDDVRRALEVEDATVVGFVGTFGPWHGAPVLGEAARLVSEDSACHFLFVGDGDERARTEEALGGVLRQGRAHFAGRIAHDRVPAYLDACDILVSPHVGLTDGSDFFGSPTKLFEYMAMARPVIASRLGQIAEVIVDGENGLLVEPGDAKALARAIEFLSRDRTSRERLGTAARKTVIDGYTWQHNAARVFEHVGQLDRQS